MNREISLPLLLPHTKRGDLPPAENSTQHRQEGRRLCGNSPRCTSFVPIPCFCWTSRPPIYRPAENFRHPSSRRTCVGTRSPVLTTSSCLATPSSRQNASLFRSFSATVVQQLAGKHVPGGTSLSLRPCCLFPHLFPFLKNFCLSQLAGVWPSPYSRQ